MKKIFAILLAIAMLLSLAVCAVAEKPEPVVSEMEQAGFTSFMEVGVPYTFANRCANNEELDSVGEATVVSFEIFESADGYEPLEGYEWRTVTIETRFFDDNAWKNGVTAVFTNSEDYYNTKLLDDTAELIEETDAYDQYRYTIIHNGQEMDAYYFCNYGNWSGWLVNEDGKHECRLTITQDFLVPMGYDGCVAGIYNSRVEWPDDAYITDLNPEDFLLFRLN